MKTFGHQQRDSPIWWRSSYRTSLETKGPSPRCTSSILTAATTGPRRALGAFFPHAAPANQARNSATC